MKTPVINGQSAACQPNTHFSETIASKTFRVPSRFLISLFAAIAFCSFAKAATESSEFAVRQLLNKTLLSEGAEQQTNLTQLADTGSKLVHDVLTAWTRDG